MELKKGTTTKTFIPKVAEGVFTVICMFTDSDEYVLYYHSGKKTLRVFRTSDAQMIANYKMQAELTAIKSTKDGQSLVLGTVDGCLSVFCIADQDKPELQELLKQLPSRDINVRMSLWAEVGSILTFFRLISVEEKARQDQGDRSLQSRLSHDFSRFKVQLDRRRGARRSGRNADDTSC